MKAAVLDRYDKKGRDLNLRNVPVPEPNENEVLVKVHAAGVNPLDNMIVRGEVRLIVSYKTPLVMGNEFSGVVEKAGSGVSRFKPGDRVYGRMPLAKIGAFAEYAAIDQSALAIVPEYLDYPEAATVPLTALTAMQSFDILRVQPGQTVFISGGTGSFGSMAIPIAKKLGLHVVTSGSASNRDRVLALGADRFIDYKTEEYVQVVSDVDCVIDSLGESELVRQFGILKEGGRLVSLRGLPNGRFAQRMGMSPFKKALFGMAGRKYDKMAAKKGQTYDFMFVREDGAQLDRIGRMFDSSSPLPTSVDAVYPLDQVNAAMEKVRVGRSRGKTVIEVSS